jgi:kynurenine formamidase
MFRYAMAMCLSTVPGSAALTLELDDYRLVDLTHSYNEDTIYWPTSPSKFQLTELARGETPGGWFYSAYMLCSPEHGGTHLDAPAHFSASGMSTDALPLRNLIAPAVVVDISAKARRDPNYRLSVEDVRDFESRFGTIDRGTIVLLRTDWSGRWPEVSRYLGDDTPGDASNLSFPSYGSEAATLLVEERGVVALGVDTASIDFGPSQDFPVHRIAAASNVAGLENLTNLGELPATGATVLALPMKIEGGSGGPVRVVALVGP